MDTTRAPRTKNTRVLTISVRSKRAGNFLFTSLSSSTISTPVIAPSPIASIAPPPASPWVDSCRSGSRANIPDMISSASNFMGSSEFFIGPQGFPSEYRHDEMADNYDGVRTRLVTGSRDFIRFYHQPDDRALEIPAPRLRDRGIRLRPRHARHVQDLGLSHAGVPRSSAAAHRLDSRRCLSELQPSGAGT